MMPKWAVVLVGCVLCPVLGITVFYSAIKLRAHMLHTCGIETTPGEGLGLVAAAPIIILGTVVATGVLYSLTVTLVKHKGSAFLAIALTIIATIAIVPVAVNRVYEPTATPACSNGLPSWWPTWIPV